MQRDYNEQGTLDLARGTDNRARNSLPSVAARIIDGDT
jgi:hypothetical protein